MARRERFSRRQNRTSVRREPEPQAPRPERRAPTQYAKPIVILEDAEKNTFEFVNGAWVPFAMTIAECREECQVRALPQQVNGKTRYEIRLPIQESA